MYHMIPLFKSHFSIGKSILRLGGGEGIFDIARDLKLKKVVLVEDSLTGFLETAKMSKCYDIDFVMGLRISVCDSDISSDNNDCHKLIVFAKNGEGCKLLNKIYTKTFSEGGHSILIKDLKTLWDNKLLKLSVPFYDSFIFNNTLRFSKCMPVLSFTEPTFFIENNGLPFDSIIKKEVELFCKKNNFRTEKAKTIYYKNREDFSAFQTYKLVCNRSNWSGKSTSLECPNLDHFGSQEFCVESLNEQV